MDKIVLPRTGESTVAFEGERILFESAEVGCAHFEFHGYISHSPVKCCVMSIRERRLCGDTRDVAMFDDRASLEKGLAAVKGALTAFKAIHDATLAPDGVGDCTNCPRGRK